MSAPPKYCNRTPKLPLTSSIGPYRNHHSVPSDGSCETLQGRLQGRVPVIFSGFAQFLLTSLFASSGGRYSQRLKEWQVERTTLKAVMGEIDETFGALYVGTVVALVMFGITILQAYFYYLHYGHDSIKLKILVTSVCLLDATHSGFIFHINYYYLVSSIGHPENLQDGIWSLYSSPAITFLLSVIVQAFYITRIYQLCRPQWKWWICSPIIIFAVAHFVSGLETISKIFINATFALNKYANTSVIPYSVTYLILDTMIAVALCVLLRNRRTEVHEPRINHIINNIIIFCVERFILSMLIAVTQLVTYLVFPNTFYTASLDMVYGKLVANSLLATVNSRQALRGAGVREESSNTDDTTTSIQMSTPVHTVITGMYVTGTTAESSIDDVLGYALCTQDFETSIQSNQN